MALHIEGRVGSEVAVCILDVLVPSSSKNASVSVKIDGVVANSITVSELVLNLSDRLFDLVKGKLLVDKEVTSLVISMVDSKEDPCSISSENDLDVYKIIL